MTPAASYLTMLSSTRLESNMPGPREFASQTICSCLSRNLAARQCGRSLHGAWICWHQRGCLHCSPPGPHGALVVRPAVNGSHYVPGVNEHGARSGATRRQVTRLVLRCAPMAHPDATAGIEPAGAGYPLTGLTRAGGCSARPCCPARRVQRHPDPTRHRVTILRSQMPSGAHRACPQRRRHVQRRVRSCR